MACFLSLAPLQRTSEETYAGTLEKEDDKTKFEVKVRLPFSYMI